MSSTGQSLIYSTYLGGDTGEDEGLKIILDSASNVYVTGLTYSIDFPTVNAYQSFLGGGADVFVASLDSSGQTLRSSTYLGGDADDHGQNIALSDTGFIYVIGTSQSVNFPVVHAYQSDFGGGDSDAFMTILSPTGSSLRYSTYLGGTGFDRSYGLAVDSFGTAYIAGNTESPNFPVVNALQPSYEGVRDAFLVKIGDVVADIGFEPNPDGYRFKNYGSLGYTPFIQDFDASDMRNMFGDDAVCEFIVAGICYERWDARRWKVSVNYKMQGGHCLGMAATSQRFFAGLDDLTNLQTGASDTYDLSRSNARRHIAYYHVQQWTTPPRNNLLTGAPWDILIELRDKMNSGAVETPFLVFWNQDSGHAITPYKIVHHIDNEYRIMVYENNEPNREDLYVQINKTDNGSSWSYYDGKKVVSSPEYSLGVWSITSFFSRDSEQNPDCPWCNNTRALAETPQAEIWANAPMQLLISNNQGQRIGYDNGVLVNEIPEASYHVNIGGLGIATEPIYSIPLDSNYTITANKEVAIQAHGARRTSQEEANSIVQFGPGYANSVENIAADDQITMSTDGTNIEYLARETGKPSLTFAYRSNQFSLQDINVGAGQVITGAVDTDKSQLIYSNAQNDSGTYDLEINRVDATGVYTFTHPAISVSAGDTHYLDYGAWDGSDTMTLNIDEGSDGSIDQTVILRQADEQVYIPLVVR